ncbi:hypothetical protein [Microbacterium jejuense]|uniref:hypothetical protein n=1 Tax=Microbacterium jejuense TaxID=1263637 RepID=UPI0031EEDADB
MKPEFNAYLARLRAHSTLANKTDTVSRVNTDGSPVRTNYVVAIPSTPTRLDDDRLSAPQRFESSRGLSVDVKVVAVDIDGLWLLLEAVQTQSIGHELIVPGRKCSPIVMATDDLEEGRMKYDPTAKLYYIVASFDFTSDPA